ncbi:S8 family serine peptidase [Maricurvus nonylphenolicus]|uniref:subtilisin-like serine protease QhpE n=1 Tax=Maricurvus nonylphenolicus TaxID=1008307 RepID=UPI0036F42C23
MINPLSSQVTRVGVVDSGFVSELGVYVDNARAFQWCQDRVLSTEPRADQLGHGSAMLNVIQSIAPESRFLVAQVFRDKWATTPEQVAAALDWLVEQGTQVINLSLGLRQDRPVVRLACERAIARGVVLVAASPAQGAAVYPSAYPGIIRATGDARCSVDEISFLDSAQADFGACVRSPVEGVVGASVGTAYLTGHIAQHLGKGGSAKLKDVLHCLAQKADYWGVEKRVG